MYGIQIKNDDGGIQIANGFENMVLVAEGVATTYADMMNPTPPASAYIPIPLGLKPRDVLLFVGKMPAGDAVILARMEDRGFLIYGYRGTQNPVVIQFPYRIYARSSKALPLAGAAGSFGIQVLAPDLTVEYDSRLNPLLIRSVVRYERSTSGAVTVSGATLGVVDYSPWCSIYCTAPPDTLQGRSPQPSVLAGVTVGVRANKVEFGEGIVSTFPPDPYGGRRTYPTIRSFVITS